MKVWCNHKQSKSGEVHYIHTHMDGINADIKIIWKNFWNRNCWKNKKDLLQSCLMIDPRTFLSFLCMRSEGLSTSPQESAAYLHRNFIGICPHAGQFSADLVIFGDEHIVVFPVSLTRHSNAPLINTLRVICEVWRQWRMVVREKNPGLHWPRSWYSSGSPICGPKHLFPTKKHQSWVRVTQCQMIQHQWGFANVKKTWHFQNIIALNFMFKLQSEKLHGPRVHSSCINGTKGIVMF